MPSASYGSVPFREQQAFFRSKLNIPTDGWTDIYGPEHDWAFMVAGANRDAIVSDFRESIERMIEDGLSLDDFRKDFDRIVADHGWDYNGGREWRSRVIFETNLSSSYAAGRLAQLNEARDTLPYWEYHHSGAEHPRLDHLSWNGLIIDSSDPWWQQHYPPNGWGCGCYVTGHSEAGLREMGKTPDPAPNVEMVTREIGQRSRNGPRRVIVPKGIDPGFEYAPGQSRLHSAVPPELPNAPPGSSGVRGLPSRRPVDVLPEARPFSADRLLASTLSDTQYAEAFLDEFGATLAEPAIFEDVIGERLAIGSDLFITRRTGELKANKNQRGQFMRVLAEAIKSPDEIWVRIEHQAARNEMVIRRRYLARFNLPGRDVPALAVFELGDDGWSGITTFVDEASALNDMRIGVRLYRRGAQ